MERGPAPATMARAAFGLREAPGFTGTGLPQPNPTTNRRMRAGRVQVGQRVQGYAAAAAGKAVAEEIGDVGVGELVEGDACYKGAGEGAEQDDRGERIDFEKV